MKYLIVWINEKGKLVWDICVSKQQVVDFINVNLGDRIIRQRLTTLDGLAKVFEIEPNYEIVSIKIELPKLLNIIVED